jgi:amino acid adenylation domain-containing protein
MQKEAVDPAVIRDRLAQQLPNLTIPLQFIPMKNFPRTSNGDVDRGALSRQTNSTIAYPTDKTIADLLAEQVARTPDHIAVVFNEQTITYRELDEKSSQLAHHLRQRGVAEETLVPICLSPSLNMVIGILGIVKAGGAYVPIDPEYPADRINYMLSDCGGSVVVSDALASHLLMGHEAITNVICLDRDWTSISDAPIEAVQTALQPHNLAYVIYTSGSTGRPKGVLIEHRNVVRLFMTDAPLFDFNDTDVWTMFHSFCFDFSVWELYGALFYGGRLVVVPKQVARDTKAFGELLLAQQVTVLNQTPSAFYVLQDYLIGRTGEVPMRYVIFGGEALNPGRLKAWKHAYANCQLINMYGITETTVHVTYQKIDELQINSTSSVIGRPIPTLTTVILDSNQQPVPVGTLGELYVGGAGLARGYLNRPDLTVERFIKNPLHTDESRLYRTGDLATLLPDGTLEYGGRIDEQVKIRGYRIELGEIESVLQQQPGVKHCVVVAKEDANGDKRLIGYVVPTDSFDRKSLIGSLKAVLPAYMVPQLLMELSEIPLTSNGKVDRQKLPNPDASELLADAYIAPTNRTEEKLVAVWKDVLNVKEVGVRDNFFELGGNSLLALKAVTQLKQHYAYDLPITRLYQFPTVSGIAGYLAGKSTTTTVSPQQNGSQRYTGDVAVIGMAGRFPGANTIDALWTVLTEGQETISFFSDDELDPTIPLSVKADPLYLKARGVLKGVDEFDPAFFGLTPSQAQVMDPQQRVFLEIAWETLEQTGYLPQQYAGRVGVFAGTGRNTYFLNNVLPNNNLVSATVGAFQAELLNEKDYIATRTAYALDLKGPAVSVFSACSTSLLAVAQAVQSLRSGQCEVALAGGASVTAPLNSGHLYQEGAMLSRDGHTRTFSAGSTGTVFSDGAGVVLLKDAEAARRDGDTIWAIIEGVGVTNDGAGKGSFSAPNAEGQAAAIRAALADGDVDPATISYVEAHGTATPIGDPIEIEGLTMAFGEQPKHQFCAIGSVKSNFGHLTAAAGVAGLIKTILALHHRQLPPSLGFEQPNPIIDFAHSPFFVNAKLTEWAGQQTRRAGVSSFGVGGTNVHVLLKEAENKPAIQPLPVDKSVQLISWSAKTPASAAAYAEKLADALQTDETLRLADVAYTLHTTRPDFANRRFVVAQSTADLIDQLRNAATGPSTPPVRQSPGEVVFLFPGQGAQYLNMGRPLYENEPVFRRAVDECADLLVAYLDRDIRTILYADEADAEARLNDTRYTQPALFVTEYALAQLWMHRGIQPSVLCGHSIGEFVAAHLAGVFSLADALQVVTTRGRLVSEQPGGSMLSVRQNAETIAALLPASLSVAAINSRHLCVVAGPDEAITDFAQRLTTQNIPNKLLPASHAFHSAMMEPVAESLEKLVASVPLKRPRKPIVSTLTGMLLTDAQAVDPHYWARHLRETVQFADALDTLLTFDNPLLFDIGPGKVSATLARQQAAGRSVAVVTGLENTTDWATTHRSMLTTLGQVWQQGLTPDWTTLYDEQSVARVLLPTYAFDRQRCWVDPPVVSAPVVSPLQPAQVAGQPGVTSSSPSTLTQMPIAPMRTVALLNRIKSLLEEASGIDLAGAEPETSFIELGLDSLLLTQLATTLRREFNVPVTFRQLSSDFPTPERLAVYLDQTLPSDQFQPAPAVAPAAPLPLQDQPAPAIPPVSNGVPESGADTAIGLIAQQLQLLAKQVALLQVGGPSAASAPIQPVQPTPAPVRATASNGLSHHPTPNGKPAKPASNGHAVDITPEEATELKKPFGATARIERQASALTNQQRQFIEQLTARYTQKTAGSKSYTQQHRSHMADPRVVSGFRPLTKEVVYPLVVNRSRGSRLWDVDGNEYIDVLNGFGSNLFGYQPDYVREALHQQIENGFEVGPQHELAGTVSQMICEMTGSERAALCSTGSEAVLGAMRMARTITGRSLIVAFTGSYHGIMDEVLVRGTKKLKSFPAAAGIMPEAVENMLILDYGTDESLRIIRERASDLAAVLVEPVQSRRPEFLPTEFLREVRQITAHSGTALIFDEVITGFRMHLGGMQALLGIRADIVMYGKVVGAGLPIGIIAGKRSFMDALDGGPWQFGDDSVPEVGVTYFAGTFVRHPLALASAHASLTHIRQNSPQLQDGLAAKTNWLASAMNTICTSRHLPFFIAHFGSLWKIKFNQEAPYSELMFTLMREKGIHIWDGFPCFMTEAHTDADLQAVLTAFTDSVNALLSVGFLRATESAVSQVVGVAAAQPTGNRPPMPGARLGRDLLGNPAWFIANPDLPGKYMQVT